MTCDAIVTPQRIDRKKQLSVSKGIITSASDKQAPVIDLGPSSVLYPALLNIHDHMRGNYLPRVGPRPGTFYLNWLPWDNDLKASDAFAEREHLSEENKYFLSSYKNLFSGVITVNDHFPHRLNEQYLPRLPVRAIQEYTIEHECSSFDLKWGEGIEAEHRLALEKNWPFITHLEEGFDPESQDGVGILERHKALDEHCVLIHCIGFSDEDILKVAKAGASISWCPASNMLMFNTTCKIRKLLHAGVNVGIGTDSTHTGSENLLAEMKYARQVYQSLYGEDLPAKTIVEMVTANPAKAFRMYDRTGSIEEGKWADLLVMRKREDDPYENLASGSMEDIQLLVREGVPVYGEERFMDLLDGSLPVGYSMLKVGGRSMFVKGDPAGLYREVRRKVGFKKTLDYLPFEPGAEH
jgi:cytosine/adenosine deaminase-related metal-dependent hydrolase